jgi:glycosyltransferase
VKVSIITPVYNDVRVGQALDSIFAQRFDGNLETLVIDGGSQGATQAILERYRSRLSVFISEPDSGIYDAMNKGVALATGDVVGILNADDRYADENVLRDVIAAFTDPAIDAVYGDLVYVDAGNKVVRYWKSGKHHPWSFYLGWMPPHPAFFVRRRLYESLGAFDLRFPIAADYELILRFLHKQHARTAYVPRILVRMSLGGASNRSLKNILRANREVLQAWRKNKLAFGYATPLLKPASKIFQYLNRPPKTQTIP